MARKLGLRIEGRALRYLSIGGSWQDHLLLGLTVEEWPGLRNGEVGRHG